MSNLSCSLMQGSKIPANNPFASITIKWGLCVPKQCSETDIAVGLQDIIKGKSLFLLHDDILFIVLYPINMDILS